MTKKLYFETAFIYGSRRLDICIVSYEYFIGIIIHYVCYLGGKHSTPLHCKMAGLWTFSDADEQTR